MRLRFTVFGWEIAAIELDHDAPVEAVEDAEKCVAGGGSAHNFERDTTPLDTDERYAPWDGFGFG